MNCVRKPNLIFHADWGSSPKKRWCAVATLDGDDRYTAHAPRQVHNSETLLDELRDDSKSDGCVFAGFDFAMGIPTDYAKRAGVKRFRDFLLGLGNDEWREFFAVCDSPEQISVHRPFYPNRSNHGVLRKHLLDGHGVASMEPLLRYCDRGGNGQKQACSLFWTLGGNQVGKAALSGWKDILIPALRDKGAVGLWPFDGRLETLFSSKRFVIAETYPAECYGWLAKKLRSKSDIDSRRKFGLTMLSWADKNSLLVDSGLESAIRDGFPTGRDDAFDATVGLFGMLAVVMKTRRLFEPIDTPLLRVEGWILGRASER